MSCDQSAVKSPLKGANVFAAGEGAGVSRKTDAGADVAAGAPASEPAR
jgi:hypothetical protein